MNERFKFRAWEPLNKQMHYMDFALHEGDKYASRADSVLRVRSMNLDALTVMQFSGLQWAGKDVYEGDIFNRKRDKRHKDGGHIAGTYAYHPENSNVVRFSRGCFMVGFGTLQEFLIFASHEGHHQDLCGNIYENPELIDEA